MTSPAPSAVIASRTRWYGAWMTPIVSVRRGGRGSGDPRVAVVPRCGSSTPTKLEPAPPTSASPRVLVRSSQPAAGQAVAPGPRCGSRRRPVRRRAVPGRGRGRVLRLRREVVVGPEDEDARDARAAGRGASSATGTASGCERLSPVLTTRSGSQVGQGGAPTRLAALPRHQVQVGQVEHPQRRGRRPGAPARSTRRSANALRSTRDGVTEPAGAHRTAGGRERARQGASVASSQSGATAAIGCRDCLQDPRHEPPQGHPARRPQRRDPRPRRGAHRARCGWS